MKLTNIIFLIIVYVRVCDGLEQVLESLQPGGPELFIILILNDPLLVVQGSAAVIIQHFVDLSENLELLGRFLLFAFWNSVRMNEESFLVVSLLD